MDIYCVFYEEEIELHVIYILEEYLSSKLRLLIEFRTRFFGCER